MEKGFGIRDTTGVQALISRMASVGTKGHIGSVP
jgi:hypothetical protein